MRTKLQIPQPNAENEVKWSSKSDIHLTGMRMCKAREVDVLDVAWMAMKKKFPETIDRHLVRGLYADVSQCVSRTPWHYDLRCFVTTSIVYSFEFDRVLVPSEHLRLQGYPPVNISGLTPNQVRDLAGECFSLPACTLMSTCVLLASRDVTLWERPLQLVTPEEVSPAGSPAPADTQQ
jgi:hypothetical protein